MDTVITSEETQKQKIRVGVVIRTKDNQWSVTRFADETILSQFIEDVETQSKDLMVQDINIVQLDPCNPISPPEDFRLSLEEFRFNRQLWCPWCGEIRSFGPHEDYPYDLFCTVCHISTDEYYIRKFNNLDYLRQIDPKGDKRKKRKKNIERVRERKLERMAEQEDDDNN